jgi:hypothetical protein
MLKKWCGDQLWPGLPTFEDKYYRDWKSSGIYLRFQYYCVDDVEFAVALAKINGSHVLCKLAQNYNDIALETK